MQHTECDSSGDAHGLLRTERAASAGYGQRQTLRGAAAWSWDLALGTRFVIEDDPTQRLYVCEDRGLLEDTWVDIFFYHPSEGWPWQSQTGRRSGILVVE
jgi:hypothetical protein